MGWRSKTNLSLQVRDMRFEGIFRSGAGYRGFFNLSRMEHKPCQCVSTMQEGGRRRGDGSTDPFLLCRPLSQRVGFELVDLIFRESDVRFGRSEVGFERRVLMRKMAKDDEVRQL